VIKLFGRDGAKVRESITPSITVGDDFFTRVGMPKGDRCFEKSQGSPHPRGVISERDIGCLREFKRSGSVHQRSGQRVRLRGYPCHSI